MISYVHERMKHSYVEGGFDDFYIDVRCAINDGRIFMSRIEAVVCISMED